MYQCCHSHEKMNSILSSCFFEQIHHAVKWLLSDTQHLPAPLSRPSSFFLLSLLSPDPSICQHTYHDMLWANREKRHSPCLKMRHTLVESSHFRCLNALGRESQVPGREHPEEPSALQRELLLSQEPVPHSRTWVDSVSTIGEKTVGKMLKSQVLVPSPNYHSYQ